MKIQAIRQNMSRQLRRWMAIGGVAMMSTAGLSVTGPTSNATAQDLGGGISFRNGQLINGSEAFQVVDPSQVATAGNSVLQADGASNASIFDQGVAQVGLRGGGLPSLGMSGLGARNAGCRSCGTSSCGGACGGGVGYGGGYTGGGCGEPCQPYRYAFAEALYMQRAGDNNYTNSANFALDDFDFELAPRITFGAVPDCVHGIEGSFTGPLTWNRREQITGGAGAYNALFFAPLFFDDDANPATPVVPRPEYASFYDADAQLQRHDAEYLSFEASRTLMGWQIAKLLYGVRYIDYQEDYSYFSQAGANSAEYQNAVHNRLFGGQVGLDLFYPMGVHATADFRGRAGAYLNFADSDNRLLNNASTVRLFSDDDTQFAGVFEIGSGVRYNLGDSLSIRAGSEMWYLTGIATSTNEARHRLQRGSNRRIELDDDVIMIGLTLSAEFKY